MCCAPGRILNVAVCPADTNEPPRVLNYLTAPHVYVWSAVSCSSAFPLLFAPQNLFGRNQQGAEVTCAPTRHLISFHVAVHFDIVVFSILPVIWRYWD